MSVCQKLPLQKSKHGGLRRSEATATHLCKGRTVQPGLRGFGPYRRTLVLLKLRDAHDRLQIPLDRLRLTTRETSRAAVRDGLRAVSTIAFVRTSDVSIGSGCS